jgi:hypothetical protein
VSLLQAWDDEESIMKRVCEYCGESFNGLAKLFDHKRSHPEWVKKMNSTIDLWIAVEKRRR